MNIRYCKHSNGFFKFIENNWSDTAMGVNIKISCFKV